jgi:hypothetical protein
MVLPVQRMNSLPAPFAGSRQDDYRGDCDNVSR